MSPQTLEEMAADYLAFIREIQPNGPYNLLGWSFGGLVAHSIATHLQGAGQEVALLALLDSYPDGRHNLLHGSGEEFDKETLLAPEANYLQSLLDALRPERNHSSTFAQPHLDAIADVYANNIQLARSFLPQRFHGDVLLFVATDTEAKPPIETWRPFVRGEINCHTIHCTHNDMMEPLSAAKIGSVLATELVRRTMTLPP